MTALGIIQIGLYMVVLLALARPLGAYMARVYEGKPVGLDRVLGAVERLIYRLCGVRPEREMDWKVYAASMLALGTLGIVSLYGLLRLQGMLPLDPQGMKAVPPDLAFNTAVSFATNTNWQNYSGETTLSYLAQMLGMTVHNFVSAATGMAMLAALIRGLVRHNARAIGNFWVDLTRGVLYILLPLSVVLAVVLVAQGVVQTLGPYKTVTLLQPVKDANGRVTAQQTLPMGPAASQVAIKQLGTNGGGFFNANSGHPFENPTPLSNFLQMLAILLIPAASCCMFGRMVGDTRQGWAILAAMLVVLLAFLALTYASEAAGNPRTTALGVDQGVGDRSPGGNMEGKEVRFGIAGSALWATATTAASNGSVNSMHDSYMPLGGLSMLVLMQFGETIFGGVGAGLYGMLVFAIVAVFIAGLMVGRTPEYLGKKIEAYEMKMASLIVLLMPLTVLGLTAVAAVTGAGAGSVANPGAHGFSEILYAFTSQGNNNGSAFAGLNGNTTFCNLAGALAMLVGRFWLAIPTLAIAGSLAAKKTVPAGPGTFPTNTPLFAGLLVSVVLIVGALTFFPALALGPIAEHLMMAGT